MKTIPLVGKLGAGKCAIVDDSDYEALSAMRWYWHSGYAATGQSRHRKFMHRLLNKTPDGMETDHVNGDGLDNQKSNLRTCTHAQNMLNKRKYRSNTTGYTGVHVHGNGWIATICVGGRQRHLGSFRTLEAAVAARASAARESFGSFHPTTNQQKAMNA